MAATCAACLQPIVTGQPFALSGTEVFHRACTSNIDQSIGARLRMEIQRLKAEVLRERKEGAEARVAAQSATFDNSRLVERLARAESDLVRVKSELVEIKESANREQSMRRAAERASVRASQERDRLADHVEVVDRLHRNQADTIAARDATIVQLRNEILKHATDKIPVPENADQRDATEIRFSLLELDKP